ncbi:MAG: B12-binding domain-containing radical SAM protein [Flavobacteriales bacterium]|jgi:radical SAM superfamily enzyme YgiQ (UPF0313 family)|nr:B12-binding domain-containing radical SAM protein [Flavobacteriales bacterium]
MDVLLTHGYFIVEDEKEQGIMRPYPPLGILYLSKFLKDRALDVGLFDTTFSDFDTLLSEIKDKQPNAVAIYTNLMTKLNVIRLMKAIRKEAVLEQTKIILGGPDVTYNYKRYLKAGADFIVIGEGEETLFELVTAIKRNEPYLEIAGIAYTNKGAAVKNTARVKIKNINELPFPDREGIDLNAYLEVWKKYHGQSTISISTQRGCPYTCKWCSTAVYGQSYRRRSPELVADEVAYLIETYNPDSLWFVDDVFTVSHKWIASLHQEFLKRGIKISFECITRAERLTDEVLKQLAEMGCSKIWIGAESGSQRIIDQMDRRVDINLVREMMLKTKAYGIQSGTFIMVGYPTETLEDIYTTTRYLKAAQPDNFTITVAYPIVGTDLYNEIEQAIIHELDWETTTDRDIEFKRTYSRKFYDYAVRYIVNEVNAELKTKSPTEKLKHKAKAQLAHVGMLLNK